MTPCESSGNSSAISDNTLLVGILVFNTTVNPVIQLNPSFHTKGRECIYNEGLDNVLCVFVFLRTSKYKEGRRIVIESDHLKLVSMSAVHFQTSYRILCSTALLCTFVLNICHGSISKSQEELGGRVILSRPNSAREERTPGTQHTPNTRFSMLFLSS